MESNTEIMRNIIREAYGWTTNIEKATLNNQSSKKVLYTNREIQLAVETVLPYQSVPVEVHERSSQFIRVEDGSATVIAGGEMYSINTDDKDTLVIPAGVEHEITAGNMGLKFYTIYAPPL